MNLLLAEALRLVPSLSHTLSLPNGTRGIAVVYFLRLRSGVVYIGCSTDLPLRLDDHLAGRACRTTQIDPPIAVLRVEVHPTFPEARARETQLKGWSRAKKDALIRGDLDALDPKFVQRIKRVGRGLKG